MVNTAFERVQRLLTDERPGRQVSEVVVVDEKLIVDKADGSLLYEIPVAE